MSGRDFTESSAIQELALMIRNILANTPERAVTEMLPGTVRADTRCELTKR
jgi:hypothetical protein